jgi:uncharacterized protein
MNMTFETYMKTVHPSVQAKIAKILVNEHKHSQNDVAKMFGLNRAAVSQYISEKRGSKIEFCDEVQNKIKTVATLYHRGLPKEGKIEWILQMYEIYTKNN